MIDFFISNNLFQVEFLQRNSHEKCKIFKYLRSGFSFSCVSFLPESEFFAENEKYFLLIYGIIFNGADDQNSFERLLPRNLILSIKKRLNNPSGLRGNFTLIVLDKTDQKLSIISDLFGLSPVYYSNSNKELFVTSNLHLLSGRFPIDNEVLLEKVIFEHSLTDDTILNKVKKLNQSSIIEFLDFRIKIISYFCWKEFLLGAGSQKFNKMEFLDLFHQIIKGRANLEKPNLTTLTGGHDSRAILSAFIKNNYPVNSFSFGRPGSANTKIPERIAQKLNINHRSIYLETDFLQHYFENAIQTLLLSDGELTFEQQTTIFSSKLLENKNNLVYTGLLAGEILGPMRNIRNYLNINFYNSVFLGKKLNPAEFIKNSSYSPFIKNINAHSIEDKLSEHKKHILTFEEENLPHLSYLYQLITYGFRFFYGSQIHMQRYSLINIPCLYDFDIISMLINTEFHLRYQNNFRGLYKRRNAREMQSFIINKNSRILSEIPVDLGYPPVLYSNSISKLFIPAFYFYRHFKNKLGSSPKDFISDTWSRNVFDRSFFNNAMESDFFNKNEIIKYLEMLSVSPESYNYEKNRIVSLYMYSNLLS